MDEYVSTLSEGVFRNAGFSISKATIRNIINRKEKNRPSQTSEGQLPNIYPKRKRCSIIAKMKSSMQKENPLTKKYGENTLNWLVSSVDKIIKSDLNLKKAKKYNVHHHSQNHIYERRTC